MIMVIELGKPSYCYEENHPDWAPSLKLECSASISTHNRLPSTTSTSSRYLRLMNRRRRTCRTEDSSREDRFREMDERELSEVDGMIALKMSLQRC